MWWPTQAREPLARQKVFLSSAPHASTGDVRPAAGCRRDVAARAAHDQRPAAAGERAHDRVVGARLDRAVVQQEEVGDRRRAARARRRRGRRSARRRRCRSSSPACTPASASSSMVQRRVGQHHPELGRERATEAATGAPGRRGPARSGARGRCEQACLVGRRGSTSCGRRRGRSPSARTACPRGACARAQRGNRGLVVGAAGEVETRRCP